MSIASALGAAMSGLAATSRQAATVSSNIANSMTEGYARRELTLGVAHVGAGVRVEGERRLVDQAHLTEQRLATAQAGSAGILADFRNRIDAAVGQPGDSRGLTGSIAGLESALISASARPENEAALAQVLDAAHEVTGAFGRISAAIRDTREAADRGIATMVERLNTGLAQVESLNREILRLSSAGQPASAQMDQRQQVIDSMADILPIRQLERPFGQVVLYAESGAMLLETRAAQIGFVPTPVIDADMTLASGALSGLTLNGRALSQQSVAGGSLGAALTIRDTLAPEAQTWLDALGTDLLSRFESVDADPTRPAGAPGLFTDQGTALGSPAAPGLAGRLAVNALVDPTQGGALWRLRSGLGVATPGPAGDASILTALADALSRGLAAPPGAATSGLRSASTHAADLASVLAGRALAADREAVHAAGRLEALQEAGARAGIDTDAELQSLLLIERAFAANARVIRAADEMLQQLLRI